MGHGEKKTDSEKTSMASTLRRALPIFADSMAGVVTLILVAFVAATTSGCSGGVPTNDANVPAASGDPTAVPAASGDPTAGPAGIADTECVDAKGSNSTPQQILDAALAALVTNPVTGKTQSVLEDNRESRYGLPGGQLPPEWQIDEEASLALWLDAVYSNVPEGGDAAFAVAACRLDLTALGQGSYIQHYTSTTASDTVATTPHLLRGFGRDRCRGASIDPDGWEEQIQRRELAVQQARSDPESYKRSALAEVDEVIAWGDEQLAVDPQLVDPVGLALQKAERETTSATPAEALVAQHEADLQIARLAIEHQCPQLAR